MSQGAYAGFNLAMHVGDANDAVEENRMRLGRLLALPAEPVWLQQVHGTRVCSATDVEPCADACVSRDPGQVCAVLTADCLPVLLCNAQGTAVAAAHAGWRGLAAGIIEETVQAMHSQPAELMAWLGPAIGPEAFEVGAEVRQAFLDRDGASAAAFREIPQTGKWLMDLYVAARLQLAALGVERVYGGGFCTYRDAARFYSYRRDHITGRMASLIWISPADGL